MERRHVLVFKGRAFARVIEKSLEETYFDAMYVKEPHRRRGIATQLLQFSITHLGRFPELDIRRQSLVAQRIAKKTGYNRMGESERYKHCDTWKHPINGDLPNSSDFQIQSQKTYQSMNRLTVVYYLCLSNGSNQRFERYAHRARTSQEER